MAERDFDAVTRGAPAHPNLLQALQHWHAAPGLALDLGCGAGRDTLELLRQGWQVLAVDNRQAALDALREQVNGPQAQCLELCCADFQSLPLPAAQLINAGFSLPFCPPDDFAQLWQNIEKSLCGGGLFSGHFFGDRDQWIDRPLTLHNRQQLDQRLSRWDILHLDEYEWDGKTATGSRKHWHLFSVVARSN